MANPLEIGNVSPPAPNPDAGNALQQGSPQAPAQPTPAPTHAQTVAALRHFDAIKGELTMLLNNPALGKSNLKSAFIDGVSKLVAERMMSPADAVIQLSNIPEDPIQQRKFVQQKMIQTIESERGIIAHHAVGFAGQPAEPTPSADNHMQHISALGANYGGSR